MAAEPASVAVREQAPEVEAIIKELEVKASLGQGTWLVRSGRQDAPSESFETVVDSGRWIWRSLEKAPSKSTGYTLYCDGHDSYVLPDLSDQNQTSESENTLPDRGVRFQNDILHKGSFQDYRFRGYLMHLHLMPRQFLGSLGGLRVVGKETLDNIEYVHLKADPKDDTLTKTDPALQIRRSAMPTIDFYYQPQQKLIKRMIVTSGSGGGMRQEFILQNTETFGTSERWPAQVTIKTVAGSGKQVREIEKPYLLTVEKFAAGNAAKTIDAVAKQVAQTPFFTPVIDGLRTQDFYRQALSVQDNLSDRVALAYISFWAGDVQEGLVQWDTLDARLDATWRKQLIKNVLPIAAGGLVDGSKKTEQAEACIKLLRKLSAQLDDKTFRTAGYGLYSAWSNLHKNPLVTDQLKTLEPALLDRFVKLGQVPVFEGLVKQLSSSQAAGASKQDADLIQPYLKSVLTAELPESGFTNSQLNYLVLGAVRAKEYALALEYLKSPVWNAKTKEDAKEVASLWISILNAASSMEAGEDKSLFAVIQLHQKLSTKPQSEDKLNSTYGRYALTNAGKALVEYRVQHPDMGRTESLVTQSVSVPGAREYWGEIIPSLAQANVTKPRYLYAQIAPMLKAYATAFNQPDFEANTWLSLARNRQIHGKYTSTEIEYLNKALASASGDKTKQLIEKQIELLSKHNSAME